MKALVKLYSMAVILIIGLLAFLTLPAYAANDLNHTGDLRLKTDRISQSNEDRQKMDSTDNKETELDKIAPDLFKEQTRDAIRLKKKELANTTKTVEEKLFVSPNNHYVTMKDTEKTLFPINYNVQTATDVNQDNNETPKGSSLMGKKAMASLFGLVLIICGGIFAMMRKIQ